MEQINSHDCKAGGTLGVERIAYSVAEAATVSGLGRTTLYSLMREGVLPSRMIAGRRLIRRDDLIELFS